MTTSLHVLQYLKGCPGVYFVPEIIKLLSKLFLIWIKELALILESLSLVIVCLWETL